MMFLLLLLLLQWLLILSLLIFGFPSVAAEPAGKYPQGD